MSLLHIMACNNTSNITTLSVDKMEDPRGLTLAGIYFEAPEFLSPSKTRPSGVVKTEKKTSKGGSRPRAFPVPIAPKELDLESTLVGGESFLSSTSASSSYGRASGGPDSSLGISATTSYSRAVNRGRVDSLGGSNLVTS